MSATTAGVISGKGFRDRLREAIGDPVRRMVLDADEVWRRHGDGTVDRAVFLTSTGRYHRKFITLWELFDERGLFNECVQRMAEVARQIRDEKGYTTIVTSTAAAKHLVEHVHAQIESAENRLTVHYLGPYPFLAVGNRGVMNFSGERVLIIADVIDSGTVVGNLAKAVRDLGGTPVAALCLVLVKPEHIRAQDEAGTLVLEIGPKPADALRVHSLTDFPLPDIAPEQIDPKRVQVMKLDPETLLPIVPPTRNASIVPAIDARTMYEQFEESGAISFGFFRTEAGLLTTAVRFAKLFAGAGPAIWDAIRPHIDHPGDFKPPVVVTTFDWGDVALKEFVEDRLSEAGEKRAFVFAGRRGNGDYFLLDHYREELAEQRVVLLLSSVQTGHKVKDLATLLASLRVREIRVVCLVNRMGRRTGEFLGSILQLMRGLGEGGATDSVPFYFHPVYCLPDLPSEDIRCALDAVRTLFDYYHDQTRVPSFRRWVNQLWVYFEPRSLTAYEFANGDPIGVLDPDPVKVRGPGDMRFTVRTEDAKLSLICARAAADRDYESIIQELATTERKHTLYKLFAVLLGDVSYLRMVCRFSELRHLLHERIEACREERLRLEEQPPGKQELRNRIEEIIELETHLLFGWAMFSHLDQNYDYGELAWQAISCGKQIQDWDRYPENFALYFGEERVAWTVSMLLLLSHPRFRILERAEQVRNRLIGYIKGLIARIQAEIEVKGEADRPGPGNLRLNELFRIKSNLDMLLTDLGLHELRLPVQVIRYLHSLLLKPRKQHSPIETNSQQAMDALDRAFSQGAPPTDPATRSHAAPSRVEIKDAPSFSGLDDGIYIAGQLQTIAEAVDRLFFFGKTSREQARRFMAPPDEPGFAADVARFGDMLQTIRGEKWVSIGQIEELTGLREQILHDLWDEGALLRKALRRYVVPLESMMAEAMRVARRSFRGKDYENVWDHQIIRFERESEANPNYVLIDPLDLKEVLKNIFTNVRYNFEKVRGPAKGFARLIKLHVLPGPVAPDDQTAETCRMVSLRLVSKGRRYNPERARRKVDSTFEQHKQVVNKYGGDLRIGLYTGKKWKGTQVELQLISRNDYPPARIPEES